MRKRIGNCPQRYQNYLVCINPIKNLSTTMGGRWTELITVCEIAFVRLSNFWVICHSLHSTYACGRKRPRRPFLFLSRIGCIEPACTNENGLIDLLSVLYGESCCRTLAREHRRSVPNNDISKQSRFFYTKKQSNDRTKSYLC